MNDMNFQKVFDCLQKVLPGKWDKVVFYANYFQGSYSMKYYVQGREEKYTDCFSLQGISKSELLSIFGKIDQIILEARNNLKDEDKWSVLTLEVDKNGSFHADYDYTDFPDGVIAYEREWKRKHLV